MQRLKNKDMCLCNPKKKTSTCTKCSACSGGDCSADFNVLFKDVDCNASVVTSCPTKEQVEINWKILQQMQAAMCDLKDYKLHKETTYQYYPVPKFTTSEPNGAPSKPCIGDLHTVIYLEVAETDTTEPEYSFGLYVWNGTKWQDLIGDSVCLSDTVYLAQKPERYFEENVINKDRIFTGMQFIDYDYRDLDVYWNDGHKIYHKDEQTLTGTVVYDWNTLTGEIMFLHGKQGSGTYLTPIFLGETDFPAYFEVKKNIYATSKNTLSC